MPTVYSTQFALVSVTTGGPYTVYTVPTGKVAVVRSVTMGTYVAGAAHLEVAIDGAYPICSFDVAVTFTGEPVNMRHVLNAGDTIQVVNVTGDWVGVISGYLLDA
jgi:hypothetical protein